jgi:hypothetical protein
VLLLRAQALFPVVAEVAVQLGPQQLSRLLVSTSTPQSPRKLLQKGHRATTSPFLREFINTQHLERSKTA